MNNLEQQQKTIIDEIKAIGKRISSDVEPIWDGVYDTAAYSKSSPKVMWILKEPYCDSGGWSLPEFLAKKPVADIRKGLTWKRVNEVMYAIRRMYAIRNKFDFQDYSQVDNNYLKDIAWINLSKTPGASNSSDKKYIGRFKSWWAEVVKKQIEVYAPEIIIFGNNFDSCKKELFPDGYELKEKTKEVHIYTSGARLLLFAYHPGYISIKDSVYVNTLIDSIYKYCNVRIH